MPTRFLFWLLVGLYVACVAKGPLGEGNWAHYPGELVPTSDISGDFVMRQQIRFHAGGEQGSFEAVVQKHCDEVTIVGLTPFGTRAFSIRQRGLEVREEPHNRGAWPFPLRNILLDVHRAYFLPIPKTPKPDGWHEARRGAEIVAERWAAGRLVERSFRRVSGDPPGRIVIRYVLGSSHTHPAREIRLENEWLGYRLDVTTVSREELTCP